MIRPEHAAVRPRSQCGPSRPHFIMSRAAALRFAGATAALAWARAAAAQELTPLVVAPIPSDIAGEGYYAADTGIFRRYGFDARFAPLQNGAAISSAVAGGAADVGYSNVISLAIAHQKGLPFTILQPANLHVHDAPTAGLLAVKKTSPLARAQDFAGKTVAVSGIDNIAHIACRAWIDQHGGESASVAFVELPFAAMAAAVEAGRVDAAAMDTTGDPTLGGPADPLRVVASTFDAVATRFAPSVWFTTTDWVARHPASARSFIAALRDTAAWANAHRAESAVILAKYTHQSPDAIARIARATFGERLTVGLIQPNIDAAARYGVVQPFGAAELISPLALT